MNDVGVDVAGATAGDAEPDDEGRGRRWRVWNVLVATVVVGVPLIVAVVVLSGRRWYPVLDLAMTELRLRDVGTRHTPLIGLPGRIGTYPDQGSHPGPLSFWLLAPAYRRFGSSAWSMEAATVVLQMVWISLTLWIGQRRLGRLGLLTVAAVVAVLIRGYGLTVLVQPWNPYLPLLAWLVVLLATWSVLAGDHRMLIPLAVGASFAAQTHIPYLILAGSLGLIAVVVVVVRAWRTEDRSEFVIPLAWCAGVFAVLWVGPLVDQLVRDPGNIKRLIDHFLAPSEDTLGLTGGFELLLRHLDVVEAYGGLFTGTGSFLEASLHPDGAIWPGLIVLTLWVWAAATSARLDLRSRRWSARTSLHATIAVTLLLSLFSMMRIFGKIWFYLTLWGWVTTTLALVAISWTALTWLHDRGRAASIDSGRLVIATAVGALVATAATTVAAFDVRHPEERLGETLGMLVEPTAEAIAAGVGAATGVDGRYVVTWTDAAHFGSQGFGLVSELEREGLDVGVYDTWRVPATQHRVIPIADATAEVILATGENVDIWRRDPNVVEVATVDPRTAADLVEYRELRTRVIEDLRRDGLDDLVPLVDSNLFGLLIEPQTLPSTRDDVDRMLWLGQETAVFIGAPALAP